MTVITSPTALPSASREIGTLYTDDDHSTRSGVDRPDSEVAVTDAGTQARVVLVVDDEPTVRFLITEVLYDLAYTALEASDGPSGLQILRSDAPIDLLITDVGLPGGMNGRHLAQAARAERPGLAVLFITGYAETAVLDDGTLEPGMMLLAKPFSLDALASHIQDLTSASR